MTLKSVREKFMKEPRVNERLQDDWEVFLDNLFWRNKISLRQLCNWEHKCPVDEQGAKNGTR